MWHCHWVEVVDCGMEVGLAQVIAGAVDVKLSCRVLWWLTAELRILEQMSRMKDRRSTETQSTQTEKPSHDRPVMLLKLNTSNCHHHQSLSLHFSGHFPGGPRLADTRIDSILDFIGAKDDGSGCDNWSYKVCKASVRLSPPTYQHPVLTDQMHWLEKVSHSTDFLTPSSPGVFHPCRDDWGLQVTLGGLSCLVVLLMPVPPTLRSTEPRAGSWVVRIDPLRCLAGCHTRRLNQA